MDRQGQLGLTFSDVTGSDGVDEVVTTRRLRARLLRAGWLGHANRVSPG